MSGRARLTRARLASLGLIGSGLRSGTIFEMDWKAPSYILPTCTLHSLN